MLLCVYVPPAWLTIMLHQCLSQLWLGLMGLVLKHDIMRKVLVICHCLCVTPTLKRNFSCAVSIDHSASVRVNVWKVFFTSHWYGCQLCNTNFAWLDWSSEVQYIVKGLVTSHCSWEAQSSKIMFPYLVSCIPEYTTATGSLHI